MNTSRLAVLESLQLDKIPRIPPARTPPEGATQLYHLADGIILSIGPTNSRLVDLNGDDELTVDFRYVNALEQLALGWDMKGVEQLAPKLVAAGFLAEGPPKSDSVLAGVIGGLDAVVGRELAIGWSPRVKAAHEATLRAHARRKRFFEQIGQCPVLPETAVRRALTVGDAAVVGKKKVLCLGDDDLVAMPLAMLGHEVSVFDIDDFLLRFLGDAAREQGVSIEAREVDLRDPMPPELLGQYDVVLTDPMANRECFELFLSRAISLCKPGGRLLSAVFPPTTKLFKKVASELGLRVDAWHARHNRYYTHAAKLHWYESDWVELSLTETTKPTVLADAFSVPLNLYREDFAQRRPSFIGTFEDIGELRFAMPYFLDLLVDVVEKAADLTLTHRIVHPGLNDWSVVHGTTEDGHLLLHVDRRRKVLSIELVPFVPQVEDAVRHFVMNVYKPNPAEASVVTSNIVWELRVR